MASRDDEPGLDHAWRVHDAQTHWTSQVESKASIVLAIETAVLAGVVTLAGDGHRLSNVRDGWPKAWFISGVSAMVVAVVAVALVVRPQLRNKNLNDEATDDYIFFGHVRKWDPKALADQFAKQPMLPVVSRQIPRMAAIAWRKHRHLQVSLTAALIGSACLGLAALTNG